MVSAQEVTQCVVYVRLPVVLLTYLCIMYKSKDSTLYLKSVENNISYSLSTVHHKLRLRKASGVPRFWNMHHNIL